MNISSDTAHLTVNNLMPNLAPYISDTRSLLVCSTFIKSSDWNGGNPYDVFINKNKMPLRNNSN
jgi:hypothetical protein